MLRKLKCFLQGHAFDKTHGYYDEPAFGAVCLRCFKKAETREEWKKRYNLPKDY